MENLNKRPSKGILRFSEGSSRSNSVEKDIKWDETNIKETLHPDDKDYGFMRIDEPPTPYSRSPGYLSGENSDDDDDMQRKLNKTNELLERVSKKIKEPPVAIDVDDLIDADVLESIERDDPMDATNGTISTTTTSDSGAPNSDRMAASSSSSAAATRRRSSASHARFPSDPVTSSSSANNEMDLDQHQSEVSRAGGSCSAGATSSSTDSGANNKNDFELKRKRHYNEFHAVKLAKKLMEKELEDDDDDDDEEAEAQASDTGATGSGEAEAKEAQQSEQEQNFR